MMRRVEFDEEGYPIPDREMETIGLEGFTEEDYAFLEEFREMAEEFA